MKITVEQLKQKGACDEQVELFEKTFGESVEITEEICRTHGKDFDIDLLAENFLKQRSLEKYNAETEPAWEKYNAEKKSAQEKYDAECAMIFCGIVK